MQSPLLQYCFEGLGTGWRGTRLVEKTSMEWRLSLGASAIRHLIVGNDASEHFSDVTQFFLRHMLPTRRREKAKQVTAKIPERLNFNRPADIKENFGQRGLVAQLRQQTGQHRFLDFCKSTVHVNALVGITQECDKT